MELVDIERKRALTRKLFVWPLEETAGDGSGQGEICGSFFWLAPTERAGRKNGPFPETDFKTRADEAPGTPRDKSPGCPNPKNRGKTPPPQHAPCHHTPPM